MDSSVYLISALMPLAASMLVFQTNPYHALVIRGILGAVAALTYTVLGAPDVALTEALVGTLLAVTLYAVAIRSSLVLRLGVLKEEMSGNEMAAIAANPLNPIVADLRRIFSQHHLRVELVPYREPEELHQALLEKEIHAACVQTDSPDQTPVYTTLTRLPRLYEIMQAELVASKPRLIDLNPTDVKEAHR